MKGRHEWEESESDCWGLSRYLTDLSVTVLRLRRVEERDAEVPRYPLVPGYDDPYVPDVQE